MAEVRILTARAHRLFAPVVRELSQRLRAGECSLMLVPEQFTLAAEQELLRRLNLDGLFMIDVVSPSRVYEHVLNAAGHDEREPLSDAGRRMAISQALEKLEDQLPYYGSIAQRRGFVEQLSALITDLKRGGLDPEGLEAYAATVSNDAEKEKLRDLARIYAQYRTVLKDRFSDSEDRLAYVAGRLAESGYLHGKHLYVYGFDALPEQLMQLLRAAAPLCESLTIALICDGENAPDGELYKPVRQGIARFRKLLMQDGLSVRMLPQPSQPLPHAAPIAYLDSALFTYPVAPFDGRAEGVYLSSGLSPFEECAYASREILYLLQNGVDIEQIAVLYPEGSGYEFALTAALSDSGIPFFTDEQLPAASHGLVRFLLCALRAMAGGWRNRDMLGMLKSGYAPLTFSECCELENYAYCCGIDRARWTKPFSRGDTALCERAEALRLRLMAPLETARAALVAARDTTASLTAVFTLLTDVDAYAALQREEERLLDSGFTVRAGQNSQIWQAVLTLLDQLVKLGGGARIPLKHIATRLECGFSALSLAALPPAGGMLHVGKLGHLLAEDADAVFLLGLSDSVLTRATDGLLTPEERARAQEETGAFLGLTDESRGLLAKLDLKRAMTLPKHYLFLSCAKTDPEGAALRPLTLLNTLSEKLFHGLESTPAAALPLSATQALGELGLRLRAHVGGVEQLPDEWRERLTALLRSPATAPEAMRLLRALSQDGSAQALAGGNARALFGDETLSVSRLEQFADCPFKHFVTYGLRPHVLREWKIDPLETGTFYHAGLNNFSRLARRTPDYPNVSAETVTQLAERAIAPLLEDMMAGPMGDGDRSLARFERARSAIRRAALTITGQLAAGKFSLHATEAAFGYEGGMPPIVLVLSDGREVALRGRIDRIDRYDAPNAVYLRVIDYKSSQQQLDAARTWWGLQLQLLLYLDVCTGALAGSKPAGAFYFYVADPLVESDTDLTDVVEKKLREVFQLRGITLSDVEILAATDENDTAYVLPPIYLKSGELKKTARALDLPQLTALIGHAREVATDLADRLFGGETTISPTQEESRVSCDLCDFRPVCRFDATLPDAPVREVPEMSMEALRQALSTADSPDA